MADSPVAVRRPVLGVDADVLVHWAMSGAPHHRAVRNCFEAEARRGRRLGLTLQVLREFLHVTTDPRRFEAPLSMSDALRLSRELAASKEVETILPSAGAHDRLCELMESLRLGRKRILDTSLAVTLEGAGVTRLATLNGRDFAVFPFLEIVDPSATSPADDAGVSGEPQYDPRPPKENP